MNTTPVPIPHLASLVSEGKTLLSQDPDQFGAWIVAVYQEQETADWVELLHRLYDLPSIEQLLSTASSQTIDYADQIAVTVLALQKLLVSNQLRLAYLLYTPLIQAGILPCEKVLDLLLSLVNRLENSPTRNPEQRFQVCLQLREMAFELDPSQRDNLQALMFRALQTNDELAVVLY
ncbi:MAG: hypothetical protein Q6L68_14890, partial [Thermostichus sp. DG02_5_bins_236]